MGFIEDNGYEIIRELGANHGAGRVTYLCRDTKTEKLLVVKEFQFARTGANWDGYKAIEREASILKQINHPNVPRYLGIIGDSTPCIVQEYIEAQPLSKIMESRVYTPDQVKDIILHLLDVLIYLQENFTDSIIHRDIKPDNILIDENNKPYLIDFGGAKVSNSLGGSTVASGTLGYMPPEQRIGKFGDTTDVYSLGLTVLCWLTRTKDEDLDQIIDFSTNQILDLRGKMAPFSIPFVNWVEKITQPRVIDRYKNARETLNAIEPVYIKRTPQSNISSTSLTIKADILGAKFRQSITTTNPIPDTILQGSWEVVPHPNDTHQWIFFDKSRFSGNECTTAVIIDTARLMLGKQYQRDIVLSSNAQEPQTISIKVDTRETTNSKALVAYQIPTFVSTAVASLIIQIFAITHSLQYPTGGIGLAISMIMAFILGIYCVCLPFLLSNYGNCDNKKPLNLTLERLQALIIPIISMYYIPAWTLVSWGFFAESILVLSVVLFNSTISKKYLLTSITIGILTGIYTTGTMLNPYLSNVACYITLISMVATLSLSPYLILLTKKRKRIFTASRNQLLIKP